MVTWHRRGHDNIAVSDGWNFGAWALLCARLQDASAPLVTCSDCHNSTQAVSRVWVVRRLNIVNFDMCILRKDQSLVRTPLVPLAQSTPQQSAWTADTRAAHASARLQLTPSGARDSDATPTAKQPCKIKWWNAFTVVSSSSLRSSSAAYCHFYCQPRPLVAER